MDNRINMNHTKEVTKKIYMLSGLGCDTSNVNELEIELNKFSYTIEYINLPGQFSNIDVKVENEEDFEKWIETQIPKNSIVIGYSLGADLLVRNIERIKPDKLIILDGAIITNDFTKTTVEKEVEFSRRYIKENSLEMNADTISNLLYIKFKEDKDIFDMDIKVKTLLLLADTPDDLYEYKKNKIEKNNNQENIKSLFIPNTSHNFHTEKPVEIAECIDKFLNE
ncbi:alpha/beta hydrolase [Finegoldia magna]|uniref:alpha/beta hydrolase n=2 Tax=Finegoldia magna TaxID=1260 RepID=UPI0029022926|nr:alpha/beta hydrolase [Finegoldia magna]MDU2219291.1 alpha/beta hydrolase [Finegoldia magna]MDU6553117.1 alpha/beta hydrolase [Finegoldia magna]